MKHEKLEFRCTQPRSGRDPLECEGLNKIRMRPRSALPNSVPARRDTVCPYDLRKRSQNVTAIKVGGPLSRFEGRTGGLLGTDREGEVKPVGGPRSRAGSCPAFSSSRSTHSYKG